MGVSIGLLPDNLSSVLQPLNHSYFDTLKLNCDTHCDNISTESLNTRAMKDLFFGWHQTAWKHTADLYRIESAWRRRGNRPLDSGVVGAVIPQEERSTPSPPPEADTMVLRAPTNLRILRQNDSMLNTGSADLPAAYDKLKRGFEALEWENEVYRMRVAAYEETRGLRLIP